MDLMTKPFRILLALGDITALETWVAFAVALGPDTAEVHLRGLVTMPADISLSEGALQARQMRAVMDQVAHNQPSIHDEVRVYVDHHPMRSVIAESFEVPFDVLLSDWSGPYENTGGLETTEILRDSPCDVVLISGKSWQQLGNVLLSLRGGPNLSLGTRVAEVLADSAMITLFHAEPVRTKASLLTFNTQIPVKRTVMAVGDVIELILLEATQHKAIVMGAGSYTKNSPTGSVDSVIHQVYKRANQSIILVRAYQPEEIMFHRPRPLNRVNEPFSVKVDRWFAENTFHSYEFEDLSALLAMKQKQGVTIGLALPTLNEEKTVASVISTIKKALMDEVPLLDELILIDSNSTDQTVAIAESFGIPVYKHPEIIPEMGTFPGKGEALWKSLHVLKSDLIAWIDTDITNIHPRFVYGIIGPLLKRSVVQYVKGFYQRPILVGEQLQAVGGGRVTELVARPLLNLFYPELSGIIQPLSGEYAGRRTALEQMPFFTGYGVETGLLLDLHERYGLEGIAQVDLEERVHHNQPLINLSKMSFAIHQVFISRLEKRYGIQLLEGTNRTLKLVIQEPGRFGLDIAEIADFERPPIDTMTAYRDQRK